MLEDTDGGEMMVLLAPLGSPALTKERENPWRKKLTWATVIRDLMHPKFDMEAYFMAVMKESP